MRWSGPENHRSPGSPSKPPTEKASSGCLRGSTASLSAMRRRTMARYLRKSSRSGPTALGDISSSAAETCVYVRSNQGAGKPKDGSINDKSTYSVPAAPPGPGLGSQGSGFAR